MIYPLCLHAVCQADSLICSLHHVMNCADHSCYRLTVPHLQSFDELLLLKRGGYQIYFGPIGQDSQILVNCLQSIPRVPPIKPVSTGVCCVSCALV